MQLLFGLLRLGVLLDVFEGLVDIAIPLPILQLFLDTVSESFLETVYGGVLSLHLEDQVEVDTVDRVVEFIEVLLLITLLFFFKVFAPEHEVVSSQDLELGRKALNCGDDVLDEHLENRVRPSEAFAVLLTELSQVIVLFLQDGLSSISLLLVYQVLVGLVL